MFKSSKTFVRLTGKSKQCNAQKRHLRAFGGGINVHLTCKKFCWKVINLLCRLCLQFIIFSRQPQQLLLQEINNVSHKRHLSKSLFSHEGVLHKPWRRPSCIESAVFLPSQQRVCKASRQLICTWFCTFTSIHEGAPENQSINCWFYRKPWEPGNPQRSADPQVQTGAVHQLFHRAAPEVCL